MEEITKLAHCSIGTVHNVVQNFWDFGDVVNPLNNPAGRIRTLTDADLSFLNALLDVDTLMYLDELQQKLSDIQGIDVSITTLSRSLHNQSFLSRKTVTKSASERNEELRAVWQGMMAQYTDPEVFVALDESGEHPKASFHLSIVHLQRPGKR